MLSLTFGKTRPIQKKDFYLKDRSREPGANRFAFVGDTGGGDSFRRIILPQLEKQIESKPCQTILLGGDLVYGSESDGVHPQDGNPSLFSNRIRNPFRRLMKKGADLFGTPGNHDVRDGHEEKLLAYLNLPRFYTFTRGNVDFFSVDTTILLPGYDKCYKDRKDFAHEQARKQTEWLDKALAASKSKYKVVMGHYPLYCSGPYLNRGINAELVRSILQPILIKNNVDLYLAGHEHHYERSNPIYNLIHFISGSACKLTKKIRHLADPPYPRAAIKQEHQFMMFEETDAGLTFQTINQDGKVIDEGVIPPKTQPADPPPKRATSTPTSPLSFLRYATQFLHENPKEQPTTQGPEPQV